MNSWLYLKLCLLGINIILQDFNSTLYCVVSANSVIKSWANNTKFIDSTLIKLSFLQCKEIPYKEN